MIKRRLFILFGLWVILSSTGCAHKGAELNADASEFNRRESAPETNLQRQFGTTIASKKLIGDAMPQAVGFGLVKLKEQTGLKCESKGIKIKSLNLLTQPTNLRENPVNGMVLADWSEQWTFDMCEHRVSVKVDFVGDEKRGGTAFFVDMKDVTVD